MNKGLFSAVTILALPISAITCGLIDDSQNRGAAEVKDAQAEPVVDASVGECLLGDQKNCTSSGTGCPDSQAFCDSSGHWQSCECKDCSLALNSQSCSWSFQDPERGRLIVPSSDSAGYVTWVSKFTGSATTVLPHVMYSTDCSSSGGWYALAENPQVDPPSYVITTSLTLALCPSSCDEHLASPTFEFTVHRDECVVPD